MEPREPKDRITPSSPPVYDRVEWKDRPKQRTPDSVPVTRADDVPLSAVAPFRTSGNRQQQPNMTGYLHTRTGLRWYESLLERAWLVIAWLDVSVREVVSQPIRFTESGTRRWHVPDYAVVHDGGVTVVDVRPSEELHKSADVFAAARDACRAAGWGYVVVTEPDETLVENAWRLHHYRHDGYRDDRVAAEALRLASRPGTTFGGLVAELDDCAADGDATAAVMHMLAAGRLAFDLTAAVLDAGTPVRVPYAGELARCPDRTALLHAGNAWNVERVPGDGTGGVGTHDFDPDDESQWPIPVHRWSRCADAPPAYASDRRRVPPEHRDRADAVVEALTKLDAPEDSTSAFGRLEGAPRSKARRDIVLGDLGHALQHGKPISTSRLYGLRDRYRKYGWAGLLDRRRTKPSTSEAGLNPEFYSVCVDVHDTHLDDSRRSREYLIDEAFEAFADQHPEVTQPGRTTAYAVMAAAAEDRHATGTTKQQRSWASVGNNFGRWRSTLPGEYVQIDHTPLDVFVVDPVSGETHSVELTAAIDVASGAIVAYRVHKGGATSDDLVNLVLDMGTPPDEARRNLPFVGVPGGVTYPVPLLRPLVVVEFDDDDNPSVMRALPEVRAEVVVVDNGAAERSGHFLEVCERVGISIAFARVRKGSDKPHIEGWFGVLKKALISWMPGYKGGSTGERGRAPERDAVYTVEDVDRLVGRYVVEVHNATPRLYRNAFGLDQVTLSPADYVGEAARCHGRPGVVLDEWARVENLGTCLRTVQRDGVSVGGLKYDSTVLDPFRTRQASAPDGKWTFKAAKGDVRRIWFLHPGDGWVEIPWRDAGPEPFGDMARQMLLRRLGARSTAKTERHRVRVARKRLVTDIRLRRSDDRRERLDMIAADLQARIAGLDLPAPVSSQLAAPADELDRAPQASSPAPAVAVPADDPFAVFDFGDRLTKDSDREDAA